ncbi:MAG: hypothetical protein AAGI91_16155 [Bacteroidota bacterium]
MATVFFVQPQRAATLRERDFADALGALRLALGGLEGACEGDPARCRRAAAALERFTHEVERLSSYEDRDDDLL